MSIALEPAPWLRPVVRSLDSFLDEVQGCRLIYHPAGGWQRLSDFDTPEDYEHALGNLAQGSLAGLEAVQAGAAITKVAVTADGGRWVNWLLPMWRWRPDAPPDPHGDAGVRRYSELLSSGLLEPEYSGPYLTSDPLSTLEYCADMVMRNLAPISWLFHAENGAALYFHNTCSLGICVPDRVDVDASAVTDALARFGLVPWGGFPAGVCLRAAQVSRSCAEGDPSQ